MIAPSAAEPTRAAYFASTPGPPKIASTAASSSEMTMFTRKNIQYSVRRALPVNVA